MKNFLRNNKIVHVAPDDQAATTYALAAGTTDVNSVAVDTQGFKEVTFLAIFGDNVDTGTFSLELEGSADGSTNWTDITGATDSFTAGASDTDNEMLAVSVYSPQYRYVRAVSNRGVANTVLAGLLAVLSEPTNPQVDQSTSAGQFINTPTLVSTV